MRRNRSPDARTKDSSANSVIATVELYRAFFDRCLAAFSEYRSNADLDGGAGIQCILTSRVVVLILMDAGIAPDGDLGPCLS